jgi:hypothetical protein
VKHLARPLLLAALLWFAACWTQEDSIWIGTDGQVEFTSSVVIQDSSISRSEVDELTREFMKELTDAGWRITREWVTGTAPFRLRFRGSGNLRTVGPADAFYHLTRVSANEFRIRFVPAERDGNKSSRRIVFERRPLVPNATVYDAAGNRVSAIPSVDETKVYTIRLR